MTYDDDQYLDSLRNRIARYNREERDAIERCREEREKLIAMKSSPPDSSDSPEKLSE